MWMFSVGYRGFAFLRTIPTDAMLVEVTGQQWVWTFRYPDSGVTSNEMVVPVAKAIHVELTSPEEDVIHSFFLPHFRLKQDAMPGRRIPVWFEATQTGEFEIPCAELCGFGHSGMKGLLVVHTPDEYQKWYREKSAGSGA